MDYKKFCIISLKCLFSLASVSFAQQIETDTTINLAIQDTLNVQINKVIEIETDTLENRPSTAALYSAALPGFGQAYNKKYWKIPILYGGGVIIGYYINYSHQLYKQYLDGLNAIRDLDPRTEPFNPDLDERVYQYRTDKWRRNRDLLCISTVLVYILNIADAHVDAHLEFFTVDENISLNLEPSMNLTTMQTNLVGLSLTLKFY